MMMPSIFGENLFDDWMDFPLQASMAISACKSALQQV